MCIDFRLMDNALRHSVDSSQPPLLCLRASEQGGVGLGLYLCKLVALAHGGEFTIANAAPGLVIIVTLPPSDPNHST